MDYVAVPVMVVLALVVILFFMQMPEYFAALPASVIVRYVPGGSKTLAAWQDNMQDSGVYPSSIVNSLGTKFTVGLVDAEDNTVFTFIIMGPKGPVHIWIDTMGSFDVEQYLNIRPARFSGMSISMHVAFTPSRGMNMYPSNDGDAPIFYTGKNYTGTPIHGSALLSFYRGSRGVVVATFKDSTPTWIVNSFKMNKCESIVVPRLSTEGSGPVGFEKLITWDIPDMQMILDIPSVGTGVLVMTLY